MPAKLAREHLIIFMLIKHSLCHVYRKLYGNVAFLYRTWCCQWIVAASSENLPGAVGKDERCRAVSLEVEPGKKWEKRKFLGPKSYLPHWFSYLIVSDFVHPSVSVSYSKHASVSGTPPPQTMGRSPSTRAPTVRRFPPSGKGFGLPQVWKKFGVTMKSLLLLSHVVSWDSR